MRASFLGFGLIALVGLSPRAGSTSHETTKFKGARAILIRDEPAARQRIISDDNGDATTLYLRIAEALSGMTSRNATTLELRPCIELDVFLYGPRATDAPLDKLEPQQADHRYLLFPGIAKQPAVLMRWLSPAAVGQPATLLSAAWAPADAALVAELMHQRIATTTDSRQRCPFKTSVQDPSAESRW